MSDQPRDERYGRPAERPDHRSDDPVERLIARNRAAAERPNALTLLHTCDAQSPAVARRRVDWASVAMVAAGVAVVANMAALVLWLLALYGGGLVTLYGGGHG